MKKGGREMIKKFNISKILLSFFIILGLGYFVFSGIPVKKVYASGMFGLEVKGGAYFQNLSGHLAVGNGGTVITPSLLGLQTTKTEPMLKVALYLLYDNRISFTYVPYLYSGSTTISQNVYFNGQTYSINTPVTSKLHLYSYKMFYDHNFEINRYASVGLGVGVDVITAKTELDSPSVSDTKNVSLPIPIIGGRIKITPINDFSFIGKIQGLSVGSDGYYYHINAGVNYKAVGPLSIFADYIYDKVHVDTNNVDGTLEFNGPEAGVRLRF
jgi:hypothetical protein